MVVAQLVERSLPTPEISGSNPVSIVLSYDLKRRKLTEKEEGND